jgi:hypothetical protein
VTQGFGAELESLSLIKQLVRERRYHFSNKVLGFIEEGFYEEADLRACIRSAKGIHKVEDDDLGTAADGCKYTILGHDRFGHAFYTCGKVLLSRDDQRLYFFITAHEAN